MKQINLKAIRPKPLLAGGLVVLGSIGLLYGSNLFFDSNRLSFRWPVEFHMPISIEKRISQVIQMTSVDELPLTDNERYLCKKFGDQCKTALEIQRRENVKGDCEAFYINDNGTIDFGFMQVNSVHISSDIKLSQLVDCHGNIDIAYEIYKKSGWKAWTTYKAVIK